jgi:hypothetical protein
MILYFKEIFMLGLAIETLVKAKAISENYGEGFVLSTSKDRSLAIETRKEIKRMEKIVSDEYDSVIKELYRPYKDALSERKIFTDTLEKCDSTLRNAIREFDKKNGEPVEKEPGEYFVTVFDIEVTDFSIVPDEYKIFDEKKVQAMAKKMSSLLNIPGVKITERKESRVREQD